MEVVDKIESIGDYYVKMVGCNCIIGCKEGFEVYFDSFKDSKIASVYECCVSFVKWYNANVK